MKSWLACAFQRDIFICSLKMALLVGTLLVFINHGAVFLSDSITSTELRHILLTYLVPYCVATYTGVEAMRKHGQYKRENTNE